MSDIATIERAKTPTPSMPTSILTNPSQRDAEEDEITTAEEDKSTNDDALSVEVHSTGKIPTSQKSVHSVIQVPANYPGSGNYNPHNQMVTTANSKMAHANSTSTLPANIAIPLGLGQICIGSSIVICVSFQLRFQSYLSYYGSGLLAGLFAVFCGAICIIATKKKGIPIPKAKWLKDTKNWQIHVFLMSIILSLSAAVVLSIFSTSALIKDSQYVVGMEIEPRMTRDEETFEKRKNTVVAINAILLLLAMINILLCFCSIGISLRVLCQSSFDNLLSSGSSGSDVRDILGGPDSPEFQARKDRLLRWLGYQRRNFFFSNAAIAQNNTGLRGKAGGSAFSVPIKRDRLIPHLVAVPPQPYPPPPPSNFIIYPSPNHLGPLVPLPLRIPMGHQSMPPTFGFQPILVPTYPGPIGPYRRSMTPNSLICERPGRARQRSMSESSRSRHSSKSKSKKNKEVDEEQIAKTYTGLDRTVADEFISKTMNSH